MRTAWLSLTVVPVLLVACANGDSGPRPASDPASPRGHEGCDPSMMGKMMGHHHDEADAGTTSTGDAAVLYTCPMHPEVVQDHPGTCPKCGMTLKPK